MNRTQRMLHFIANATKPVTLAEITAAAAIDEPHIEAHARFAVSVAAQLSQLVEKKKITRHGFLGAYTYTPTAIALVDLRKVDRSGMPRTTTQVKRAKRPASKPAAKPAPARDSKPVARTHAQRLAQANLQPPTPRRPGERETVAEFLARGGRIQKLRHGESSQPAYIDVRAQDVRAMRARLETALDTRPANTTDDDVVAA